MEICLYIESVSACIKWAGISTFVNMVQLTIWTICLWQFYTLKKNNS